MKKKSWIVVGLTLAAVSLLIPVGESGAPAEKWVTRYNGPGNGEDSASAIAVDGAGNVYVTGTSLGSGTGTDFATVKYSTGGKQIWVKRYDGPDHGDDQATGIALDGSGNVYVLGGSKGSKTGVDITTVKYDTKGKQIWVKRYNGSQNADEYASGLAVGPSGDVYVAGISRESSIGPYFTTIKYSRKGQQLWAKTYNDPTSAYGQALAIAVDGAGYAYVAGLVISGDYDFATVKYDTNGKLLWAQKWNGPANKHDYALAIAVDDSGHVSVTGKSTSTISVFDRDWVTLGYNASGKQLWAKRYSGPGKGDDEPKAIAMDGSGNTFVTGWCSGSDQEQDYATIKYSPGGKQLWVKRYIGPTDYDLAMAIAVDGSGNVYVTGESRNIKANHDYTTLKYDTKGKALRVMRYDGPGHLDDRARAIGLDSLGNIYITGESTGSGTGYDYATIKY